MTGGGGRGGPQGSLLEYTRTRAYAYLPVGIYPGTTSMSVSVNASSHCKTEGG